MKEMAPPPRVLLEVGSGASPFPVIGQRKLTSNEYYIGIEPHYDKRTVSKIRDYTVEGADLKKNQVTLAALDGENLPFPDDSIQTDVFCNIIGDNSLKDKRKSFATEAGRIVDSEGIVTFVETYSPEVTSLSELRKLMGDQGFVQINEGEETRIEAINEYFEGEKAIGSYVAQFSQRDAA